MNLALKYRPKTLEEVVSQQEIIDILGFQVANNSTKNSYLFVGPSGCGKTTVARILANMLNGGKGMPIEIDAASNNGVDDVRDIINQANYRSIVTKYKVFIIDEVQMLSNGAWNSFLKLLEEPPLHTVFILCTTEPQKVIATVLSRVQRFDFTRIPDDKIIERLKLIYFEEVKGTQAQYEELAFNIITKQANGSMRTAISMLDKCLDYSPNLLSAGVYTTLNIVNQNNVERIVGAVFEKNEVELLRIIEETYNSGIDLKQLVKQMVEYCLESYKDFILGKANTTNDFLSLINCLLNLTNGIKYSSSPKTLIECELLIFIKEM